MVMQGVSMLFILIDVHDDFLQRSDASDEILRDFREGFVNNEQSTFAMVQSVFDLLSLVTGVNRNSDSTHPKACKIEEKHLRTVGKHHPDSITTPDLQSQHHLRSLANIIIECSIAYGLSFITDCYSLWIILRMVLDQLIENLRSVCIHWCSLEGLENWKVQFYLLQI